MRSADMVPRRLPTTFLCGMVLLLQIPSAAAEPMTLRIATFATELSRDGPGLLLRDILKGEDEQVGAVVDVIRRVEPDILLLTDFDFDHGQEALQAFAAKVGNDVVDYPHHFSLLPNSGMATGLDMDGNGRTGEPRDAQGYGAFAGQSGMALLSRFPVLTEQVVDLSNLLWRDAPQAALPGTPGEPFPSRAALDVQRLSSVGHWMVPIDLAGRNELTLMAFSATPPVFDGPEDRNGFRNADEIRIWQSLLDGRLGHRAPSSFVILGNANLDPEDGQGQRDAIRALLSDPRVNDSRAASAGGAQAASQGHDGDPALDTADWREPGDGGPGNLRVDYVLPSATLKILDSGVFWPASGEDADLAARASRHRLVWVDIEIAQ